MNDFFCDIINSIKEWNLSDWLGIIYHIVLVGGVVIACIQLIANKKAQQALRSPLLYIYCPKNADIINSLMLKNGGNVIATNITIFVTEKTTLCLRIKLFVCRKKPLSTKKTLPLLKEDDEYKIISNELNNSSNIKIRVTYYSPFHSRKMELVNYFNRNQL